MKHRADIDGLRAIAVLAVVFFHTRLLPVPGGYAGVDVFFVISGYLITGLILQDIAKGRFSIASFYERRARRILPALFSVLLFSFLAAYRLLLPNEDKNFGLSLLATVFFSSNMLFARQAGYFDGPSEMKPLLHTWSLAVEEQFYIFYPMVLLLASRFFRKRYAVVIASVFVLSLAMSIRRLAAQPAATFYLAPARAWELMLGGLLAMEVFPRWANRVWYNLLAIAGLAFIGYSLFAFSASTPFPGANALFPCVGAALLIYSGTPDAAGNRSGSFVAKVLSFRPLVFVGLISYSLYLWHWVLLVFAKYRVSAALTWFQSAAIIAVSFAVAVVSWRFIETPFRGFRGVGTRTGIFAGAAAAMLVLAVLGGLAYGSNGMPRRFQGPMRVYAEGGNDIWKRRAECTNRICAAGAVGQGDPFILWGDSHAGALAPVVEKVARERNRDGYIAFRPACAPLVGLKRYDQLFENCAAFANQVLDAIEAHHVRDVWLHGRWALYAEGERYKQEPGGPALLTPSGRVADNLAEFDRLLRSTLEQLHGLGANVTIIAAVPEPGFDVPTVLARAAGSGSAMPPGPANAEFEQRQQRALAVLRAAAAAYSVPLVYPDPLLCDPMTCMVAKDGYPLYSDEHHLSVHGAMLLAPMVEKLLPPTE
jgi:peptidoglycan/LPS O-acetylase OafA/YrhL